MKALLMRYNQYDTDRVIDEIDCMYYSTALEHLKLGIISDSNLEDKNYIIKDCTFNTPVNINNLLKSLDVFRMFDSYDKGVHSVSAIITVVVSDEHKVIGEYYIVCSNYSFMNEVKEYLNNKE